MLDEPKPPASKREKPPRAASRLAKRYWREFAPQLRAAGVLTTLDETALLLLCETYAKWREAMDKLAEHGLLVKSNAGVPVASPYHKIADIEHGRLVRLLVEFGMTPSGRAGVTKAGGGENKNPFAED
jgi:P27 family predicted phage terminase small subunit